MISFTEGNVLASKVDAVVNTVNTVGLLPPHPPRDNRFGSPLKLSKVHWVRPEVVVEVTYLTWTEGGLLRVVSYQGQREDKPARQVVRPIPHPL
jgi:ATP-dependent DNA ligase